MGQRLAVMKFNGTQWAAAADNDGAATVGDLTAASSKVTVTGGTGAVIGSGASVDVNESNLTVDDIPDKQIAFGNSFGTGITSDYDIKANTAITNSTINKTYAIRIEANGASGVGVDSLAAGSYAFATTNSDASSSDVTSSCFVRENAGVAGDIKMLFCETGMAYPALTHSLTL